MYWRSDFSSTHSGFKLVRRNWGTAGNPIHYRNMHAHESWSLTVPSHCLQWLYSVYSIQCTSEPTGVSTSFSRSVYIYIYDNQLWSLAGLHCWRLDFWRTGSCKMETNQAANMNHAVVSGGPQSLSLRVLNLNPYCWKPVNLIKWWARLTTPNP